MPGTATTGSRRMSQLFTQMMGSCPVDIQVYGACVANIEGGVNKNVCAAEFAKLRQCFQRAAANAAKK
ncbi:hypothetical protein H257_09162 [Aphanomyces astaci]|uniref:IMS import disulfide relay-system CHCH-CHCH-like Cx9C domain-containing protein n=1 Tax=Aphanomyces astaci TaxID=112090 RepID=W4GAH1_APHAT|nr:hypothetical protein H257_09162 [Aphanomyces astaci]ETV76682.1 hypothetical protein H257_09162 [Aphanomyces astaci]|eukprot:XP_009833594.1 hypothetical protein H257_09162 [Aphanomyces astaci]